MNVSLTFHRKFRWSGLLITHKIRLIDAHGRERSLKLRVGQRQTLELSPGKFQINAVLGLNDCVEFGIELTSNALLELVPVWNINATMLDVWKSGNIQVFRIPTPNGQKLRDVCETDESGSTR